MVYRGKSTPVEELVAMKENLLKDCQKMMKWDQKDPHRRQTDIDVKGSHHFKFNLAKTTELKETPNNSGGT